MRHKLLAWLLLLVVTACGDGTKQGGQAGSARKGKSTSAPYELLVVCNKDWLKSVGGEPLKDIVEAQMPCLPQAEPYFRTTTIDPSNFTKSFMFYANVITADVSRKYAKAECKVARNVYCQPQLIVSLTAPDDGAFAELCATSRQFIIDLFCGAELTCEETFLRKKHSGIVLQNAQRLFGCKLYAPIEINAIKQGEDFFWASSNTETDNYLNICMYAYPYSSPQTFSLPYFVQQREAFMRPNIRGERDDQYMSLDERTLRQRDIRVGSHYVQEVRGLWQMEHDAMGGPFISYSQLDSARQRVVVVEGFVYAPNKDKRQFLRSLEAALRTLELGDQSNQ